MIGNLAPFDQWSSWPLNRSCTTICMLCIRVLCVWMLTSSWLKWRNVILSPYCVWIKCTFGEVSHIYIYIYIYIFLVPDNGLWIVWIPTTDIRTQWRQWPCRDFSIHCARNIPQHKHKPFYSRWRVCIRHLALGTLHRTARFRQWVFLNTIAGSQQC